MRRRFLASLLALALGIAALVAVLILLNDTLR
jgi:hypothetical protein